MASFGSDTVTNVDRITDFTSGADKIELDATFFAIAPAEILTDVGRVESGT